MFTQNKEREEEKTMIVIPALLLLGSLFLCNHAEAQSDVVEKLKEAALKPDVKLECTWDCECTFKQARSCCCAADDMFKLEDDTYDRIENLWKKIGKLSELVHELTGNRKIAFKASMNMSGSCLGPMSADASISYPVVTLNHGHGYNPYLGAFTAPQAGVYVFSYTVYSHVKSDERLYHNVQLMRNGEEVASLWEDNREDRQDSGTQVVVLELKNGDQVYVLLKSGRRLCGELQYNTFTGYMLYPSILVESSIDGNYGE